MNFIKKIFIISTILLFVLLVFFGIYTVAFKKESVQIIKEKDEKFDIEDIVSEKMSNITSDSVVAAAIGPDKETIRYYDALDGRVWVMTLRGTNKEVLSSETMGVPQDVKWSSDGSSTISQYDDGEIYVYNYATNEKNKLLPRMNTK